MRHATSLARRLRQARGTALALSLLVLGILLLPDATRVANPSAWHTDSSRRQFEAWARACNAVGFRTSPAEFKERLWTLAQGYVAIKSPAERVLNPPVTQLGVGQAWRMFSSPRTEPARLWLEAQRTGEAMRPVYVSRSQEYDWRRTQFDHNRFRKLIGRTTGKGRQRRQLYRRFLEWGARELQAEQPDIERVRLRLYRWTTPAPGQPASSYPIAGSFEAEQVLRLTPQPRPGIEATSSSSQGSDP